jgi:hypothetical protein
VLGGSTLFRKREDHSLAHLLEAGTKAERIQALAEVARAPEHWDEIRALCPGILAAGEIEVRLNLLDLVATLHRNELLADVLALLSDPDDTVREAALECVRTLGDPASIEPLLAAASGEEDEFLKVELAEAAIELGDPRGIPVLLDVMESGSARQAQKDAWEHFHAHLLPPLEFHPDFAAAEHAAEIRSLRAWWEANQASQKQR